LNRVPRPCHRFPGRQFAVIDQRFGAIDQRFDRLERRVDDFRAEVLGHFDELYRRLERLDQEHRAITQARS
jgi:hypothetical protein